MDERVVRSRELTRPADVVEPIGSCTVAVETTSTLTGELLREQVRVQQADRALFDAYGQRRGARSEAERDDRRSRLAQCTGDTGGTVPAVVRLVADAVARGLALDHD